MNIEQKILYIFDGDKNEYRKFLKRYSAIVNSRNCNFSELLKVINDNNDSDCFISEKDFRSFLLSVNA